jgi:hypothetical protein
MSEELAAGAAVVPGYAGHADMPARRLSDQQVRAWVGELLAALRDRVPLEGYAERVEALLMRCEFADQHVIHAIEDNRFAEPENAAALEEYDRKLIAASNALANAGPGDLGPVLDALERAFDERAEGIAKRLKR